MSARRDGFGQGADEFPNDICRRLQGTVGIAAASSLTVAVAVAAVRNNLWWKSLNLAISWSPDVALRQTAIPVPGARKPDVNLRVACRNLRTYGKPLVVGAVGANDKRREFNVRGGYVAEQDRANGDFVCLCVEEVDAVGVAACAACLRDQSGDLSTRAGTCICGPCLRPCPRRRAFSCQ